MENRKCAFSRDIEKQIMILIAFGIGTGGAKIPSQRSLKGSSGVTLATRSFAVPTSVSSGKLIFENNVLPVGVTAMCCDQGPP